MWCRRCELYGTKWHSLVLPLVESAASWVTGSHGCVHYVHSGWFLPFSYNPSCRLASRHGRRYVNTWRGHGLCNWSPLRRQPHNHNLARTPVAPFLPLPSERERERERERGVGVGFYSSSASNVYYHTFSSLDTTTMQCASRSTASRCQCSCLPTYIG